MKTKHLAQILAVVVLAPALIAGAATLGDDFNDNRVDATKWGPDEKYGRGTLTETGGRLQYSVNGSPTDDDDLIRRWKAGNAPYDADWEMQMDVSNFTAPNQADQINSFGIKVRGATDDDDEVYVEVYASYFGGPPLRKGFDTELETDDNTVAYLGSMDELQNGVGAVRMAFNSTSKVITVYYDLNPADGYQWVQFGSFGVAGAEGEDANTDWGMSGAEQFRVYVYGFSQNMTVGAGQMHGDNFLTTGFVEVPVVRDLAVTKILAPRSVLLTDRRPGVTRRIGITIQNRGEQAETITNLNGLVTLELFRVGTNECPVPVPALHVGAPQKRLPVVLKPKRKMTVYFDVLYDCAPDPGRGKGHEDWRHVARVNLEAIAGRTDAHPECDVCPRAPLPNGVDPNPDHRVKDRGCGSATGRGVYGGDVLTDVIRR